MSDSKKCLNTECQRPAFVRGVCASCRVLLGREVKEGNITEEDLENILLPSKKKKDKTNSLSTFLKNMGYIKKDGDPVTLPPKITKEDLINKPQEQEIPQQPAKEEDLKLSMEGLKVAPFHYNEIQK